MKAILALGLTAGVVTGLAGTVTTLAFGADGTGAAAHSQISTVAGGTIMTPEQIYQADAPGVVEITATQNQGSMLGSGFVIDGQGDILTNDHVVHGGTGIRVAFSSGASYPATIVGTDPSTDVAVIHVQAQASELHPLTFGDSAAVAVGDPAYAIGSPFGLDRTMTAGIISATGRSIQAPDGQTIPDAIQTDAPINHGNSGGPLLDHYGHVVGVNDQLEGGGVNGNVGVGFAVPSDTASATANQMLANGPAENAWLGIRAETVAPSTAAAVAGSAPSHDAGSVPSHGAVVTHVAKVSPAAKAGLRAATRQHTVNSVSAMLGGDAVVRVDGSRVESAQHLANLVAVHRPGDRVLLEVVRAGRSRFVPVTLAAAPRSVGTEAYDER
jgi:S1-C subfamily serine protease